MATTSTNLPFRNSIPDSNVSETSSTSWDRSSTEEKGSLLSGDYESRLVREQKKRDKFAVEAVDCLIVILLVAGFVLITINILVLINENVNDEIPLWAMFVILWFGHLAIFITAIYSVRLMLKSMVSKGDRSVRLTQRWHMSNERRIPLIQYILSHLIWALSTSFIFVIFEILLFLQLNSRIPQYSILIVLYIVFGAGFLSSVICR